jgi:ornithine cyclodeaminase/alanine dehydrogenase-like protein (mu-crystallin family)
MTGSAVPGASVPYLGARELGELVPFLEAVDALQSAFENDDGRASPVRTSVSVPQGELLLMPGFGTAGVGVKLVAIQPQNPANGLPLIQGVFVLFSGRTLRPEMVLDGAALTTLRTAAVSALVTRHLAREDAKRLVVFGAGVQATAHIDAMCAVRSIERISIVAPSDTRADALVSALRARDLNAARSTPDAVSEADLICTCTTSSQPVFAGKDASRGVHVNAMGAYKDDQREVDGDLLGRATVVVDSREAALVEAGDLIIAFSEGSLHPSAIAGDLSDVVRGTVRRRTAEELTVFKSVGFAFEDLVVARTAYARMAGRDEGGGV